MTDTQTNSTMATPLLQLHRDAGATVGSWFGCALPDHFAGATREGVNAWLPEYRAARETVALIDKNYRTYLRFAGPDRMRYLNAILTNNIKDLAVGHGIVSLFLNPQGKIQAEIETYAEADSLLSVSYAMIRDALVPAIDKFIIMDDVTLTDETEKFGTLALEGPAATGVGQKVTGTSLEDLSELSFLDVSFAGIPCRVIKRSPGGVAGAEFFAERALLPQLWQLLVEAVVPAGGRAMGYQALSAIRLEQGIPWFSYDFGDKQIPHEAGLQNSHISYTKGCYTGQEIVERVRSRGQVNRVRVLLKLATAEPPPSGAPLTAEGKEVGHITRSAFSPSLQSAIAMAYIRRENSSPGSELSCVQSKAMVIEPPVGKLG